MASSARPRFDAAYPFNPPRRAVAIPVVGHPHIPSTLLHPLFRFDPACENRLWL